MQASSGNTISELDRAVALAAPGGRGIAAWQALLRAHASLVRELATDLATRTGLTLGDFDVLAQLAQAGGELRMTDLAARAFSSRSGMTRRVDRLVDQHLVARTSDDADARGIVVSLTETGMQRLMETLPVHVRRVTELFTDRLTDDELETLERAFEKVAVDCSFG